MAEPTVGHFFENLTMSMLSIIIALVGFWTTFIKGLVNRKDVEAMLAAQSEASQYSKDRQFIMERLNTHKEDSNILFRALEKNTEVMNDLKIQIATLAKAIEALEN
jgi:ABC-type bacteriocin/lantibiotic exporter with double-glycine peptidase domain